MLFAGIGNISAQTWRGNTIVATQTTAKKAAAEKTPFTYQTADGKTYPVYISQRGSCFIIRVSKAGKEYKQYLGKDVSAEICKKLHREYKGK